MKGPIHTWPFGKLRTWRQFSHFLAKECFIHKKIWLGNEKLRGMPQLWKAFQVVFVQFSVFLRASILLEACWRNANLWQVKYRFYIQSCHMLLKSKVVFKNCCNKTLIWYDPQWKLSLQKPNTVGTLSAKSILFLRWRRVFATGTQDLSISKNVQKVGFK